MFVCDEWYSKKGGISSFNRNFCIELKKVHPALEVFCYVYENCYDLEAVKDAEEKGVKLLFTTSRSEESLSFPPKG